MRAIDYFDKGAQAYADRTAIIDGDSRYSYRELKDASERIAGAMSAAGLQPESPVALYSPNDARVLFCMLGLLRAGGVWVPINYRNATDGNIQYLNYVEASWLFYHSSFLDSVREIKSRVPSLRHCICIDAECDGDESLERFMRRGGARQRRGLEAPAGIPAHVGGLVP